ERRWLVDCEVCQHLAIQLDIGELQPVHELAVAQSVGARGGADSHDPQRAKVSLLELAPGERKIERAFDLLLRVTIQLALCAAIAAGEFQNSFSFLQTFVSTFSARHKSLQK